MAIRNLTKVDHNRLLGAELSETLSTVTSTGSIKLTGDVAVQLTGTATAVTAMVQRSTQDPAGTANWAPADDTSFSGDLTAGIAARTYTEPAVGWWRVRVSALTGGNCLVSITGNQVTT